MWNKRADTVVHEVEPYNAEPVPAALADGTLTGEDTFYSRNHGPIPDIDPARWRLSVSTGHGASRTFSLEEIRRDFDEISVVATLQCAGNRREGLMAVRDIPGEAPWAQWCNVHRTVDRRRAGRSAPRCGVEDGTPGHVEFLGPRRLRSPDAPAAVRQLRRGRQGALAETMLAWAMNGQQLPRVHGGPVRVVVPGYIGARSVKWVDEITVRDSPSDNWFQRVAYRVLPSDADPDSRGPGDGISLSSVALNCDFLYPDPTDARPRGRGARRGLCIRRRRPRGLAGAGVDRRRRELDRGGPVRVAGGVGRGAVGRRSCRSTRPRWRSVSARGTVPRPHSRLGGRAVEPQGLREQLVGPSHAAPQPGHNLRL